MIILLGTVAVLIGFALAVGSGLLSAPRPGRASMQACSAELDTALRTLAYANPAYLYLHPADPRLLSDRELGQAWRASFASVTGARTARQLRAAAEDRRRYLDELERRYPDTFTTWLESGAADEDPLPHLHRGHDEHTSTEDES